MDEIRRQFRHLLILNEACLDEQLVEHTVILIEKLLRIIGMIFLNNRGIHANEFDEIIEVHLNEIKRKVNDIMKTTFDEYRQI